MDNRIKTELLRQHIERIATTPRPAESEELVRARAYVTDKFNDYGWEVQPVPFQASDSMLTTLQGINLVATHPDCSTKNSKRPCYCVGAHLDSRSESPGADDNGSAVAALLELARLVPQMLSEQPACGLQLVAFDLEENGMLGGAFHAEVCRQEAVDLRGMVSLEMLGYADATPGSQKLPKPLVGMYPDTGDFIAVIGNQNSTTFIQQFAAGLQRIDKLPVETLQVPDNGNLLQATRLSDHSPFWDAGYPALMITDTSFLRNPHYHLASDIIDTLDFSFLEKVTAGCLQAVLDLITSE